MTGSPLALRGPIGASAPTASTILSWRQRFDDEEIRERSALRLCVIVGIAMQLLVLGLCALVSVLLRHPPVSRAEACQMGIGFGFVLCAIMLLIAQFTKPEGRAEQAQQILDGGTRAAWRADEVAAGTFLLILLMIALYGSFALVEAWQRARARRRTAPVDRLEIARVMAEISASPCGVSWRSLLKDDQDDESLRGPVAVLLLDGWIELRDHGQTLCQRSPTMRQLIHRHPLAEVFGIV